MRPPDTVHDDLRSPCWPADDGGCGSSSPPPARTSPLGTADMDRQPPQMTETSSLSRRFFSPQIVQNSQREANTLLQAKASMAAIAFRCLPHKSPSPSQQQSFRRTYFVAPTTEDCRQSEEGGSSLGAPKGRRTRRMRPHKGWNEPENKVRCLRKILTLWNSQQCCCWFLWKWPPPLATAWPRICPIYWPGEGRIWPVVTAAVAVERPAKH
jgi:hypothetical protein